MAEIQSSADTTKKISYQGDNNHEVALKDYENKLEKFLTSEIPATGLRLERCKAAVHWSGTRRECATMP